MILITVSPNGFNKFTSGRLLDKRSNVNIIVFQIQLIQSYYCAILLVIVFFCSFEIREGNPQCIGEFVGILYSPKIGETNGVDELFRERIGVKDLRVLWPTLRKDGTESFARIRLMADGEKLNRPALGSSGVNGERMSVKIRE